MKFLGNQDDFESLRSGQENLMETLIVNSFNEGYTCCHKIIMSMREQAFAAIEQCLVNEVPADDNPFLILLQEYAKRNENNLTQDSSVLYN